MNDTFMPPKREYNKLGLITKPFEQWVETQTTDSIRHEIAGFHGLILDDDDRIDLHILNDELKFRGIAPMKHRTKP